MMGGVNEAMRDLVIQKRKLAELKRSQKEVALAVAEQERVVWAANFRYERRMDAEVFGHE